MRVSPVRERRPTRAGEIRNVVIVRPIGRRSQAFLRYSQNHKIQIENWGENCSDFYPNKSNQLNFFLVVKLKISF